MLHFIAVFPPFSDHCAEQQQQQCCWALLPHLQLVSVRFYGTRLAYLAATPPGQNANMVSFFHTTLSCNYQVLFTNIIIIMVFSHNMTTYDDSSKSYIHTQTVSLANAHFHLSSNPIQKRTNHASRLAMVVVHLPMQRNHHWNATPC